MRKFSSSFRPSRGFALVEVILALGIGTLITTAVWQVYSERQVLTRATATSQAIESLIFGADAAYAGQIEFATDDAGTITSISLPILAASMNDDLPAGVEPEGGTFHNRFGGTWTMTSATTSYGPSPIQDLLVLTTTQIPAAECQVIMRTIAPMVHETRINGTLVHLVPMTPEDIPMRNSVDLEQGPPLCQARNTMEFRHLKELNLPSMRRMYPYGITLTEEEQGMEPSAEQKDRDPLWASRYRESFLEHHNRIEAALAAREAAQSSLD